MKEEQLAPGFPTVLSHVPLQDLLLSALHSLYDIPGLPPPYCLTKTFPPGFTGTSMCVLSLLSSLGDAWPMEIPAPGRGEPASDRKLEHAWGSRRAEDDRTMTVPHLSDIPNPGTKLQQVSDCWGHVVPGSPETQSSFKFESSW